MSTESLIKMANQIGQYFSSEPDKTLAVNGVRQHIQSFWTPVMRKQLMKWRVENPGDELHPLVQAALTES
ncbi:formate dehydrogenase [Pseudomonas mediterranea]|jgi:formate dehydrogenase subunit delta|uniref:Formate dehydrogenase subunit delta n=1 Tax=Pseudomonas mediterranea TaxID=183795 RepID=A0AAX2DEN3_9PSED|nr:formate dehydrogenase subunit delta [Pseudomonas mediterranea]KGU82900.1 formate dehydrogenase [Pseudomonas mediterranea CFBP 5447]MDU9030751.1 formate dehydrogenase subunit delta [Pseudomonas mediterranea]QHA82470.1 formate dehydrogenase [Pseudomonas mediterranea]UZE03291.1 formate dehydrogenase subunit delta [Pseudomonas mediterranea]CAH0238121.1 hypothetical protein SRABI112_02793 [Pseudomonas mediterranea]